MMKFIYLLFFTLFVHTLNSNAQCGDKLVIINPGPEQYFRLLSPILLEDEKWALAITLDAVTDKQSIAIVLTPNVSELCPSRGDTIVFTFADGKDLFMKNDFDNNCDRQFAVYLGGEHGKTDILDTLKVKEISSITLYHKGLTIKGGFRNQKREIFRNTMRCLADATTSQDVANEILKVQESRVFMVVEQQPEFEGGYDAMMSFVKNNIVYPKNAKGKGTVYVSFIVERDGSVTEVKVLRGIDAQCDKEAVRATQMMPKWKPGMQNGKTVRVRFNLPIKF